MSQPTQPTALDLAPAEPLDADIQKYFAKAQEKLGMVPNVLRAYSHNPARLRNFIAFYNELMLADCGLSKLEREMIAVVVSSINRCFYCVTAHGAAVRQLSGDPVLGDLLATNYRAAELSSRHRAMLDYVAKLTETPHLMGEPDRFNLAHQGFTDRDIWDIAEVAAFFNMSNRLASAVEMMPNHDYHGMARG